MKNSFVLYTDYINQVDLLDMNQRGMLFTAIMHYAAGREIPELDGMTSMAFSFVKSQLDKDDEKYQRTVEARREAGKKGGRPPSEANGFFEKQEKAKKANGFSEKQTKAKKPDNDNVNDNDNVFLKENTLKGVKEKRFAPPTTADVEEYCREKGYAVDAERFVDFYESKGWLIGKNRMKDWRAAVRNWARGQRQGLTTETPQRQGLTTKGNRFHNFEQSETDYDAIAMERLRKRLDGGQEDDED